LDTIESTIIAESDRKMHLKPMQERRKVFEEFRGQGTQMILMIKKSLRQFLTYNSKIHGIENCHISHKEPLDINMSI